MLDKSERVKQCEQALLGCLIISPYTIPNVRTKLAFFAFQEKAHKDIYRALLSLDSKGAGIDFIAITNENAGIDPVYLSELTELAAPPSSVNYYVTEINNSYILRELYGMALRIKDAVTRKAVKKENDSEASKELLADIQKSIFNLSANITSSDVYETEELVAKNIENINSFQKNKNKITGYSTGLKSLDEIIDGLQNIYMIIGARPSMGKTALATKIAWNISKQNIKTLFIELEMTPLQIVERITSMLVRLSVRAIKQGLLTQEQAVLLQKTCGDIAANKNLILAECPGRQLDDIINLCRAQVRSHGVKAIFIDHIGLIRINERLQGFDKVREISNTLQQLQRELNVPIVALCQLSRPAENNKEPGLAEIRGSGAIEEDTDVCLLIGRERAKDEKDYKIETNLYIRKNRNGAVGTVKTFFLPYCVNFIESN